MKKIIMIILLLITVIACKKTTTNTTNNYPAPIPNYSYHKGKYTGFYINQVDNTDTLFVYTQFVINTGSDTNNYLDINGEGAYCLYTKHFYDYYGSVNSCIKRTRKDLCYYDCSVPLMLSTEMEKSSGLLESWFCCTSSSSIPVTYKLDKTNMIITLDLQYPPCGGGSNIIVHYSFKK